MQIKRRQRVDMRFSIKVVYNLLLPVFKVYEILPSNETCIQSQTYFGNIAIKATFLWSKRVLTELYHHIVNNLPNNMSVF